MSALVLKDLGKVYADGRGAGVTAVKDVCLNVEPGELMVLVGPSGCGKSTLLRMIAGLEPITRGSIEIDGRDVSRTPPKDRDVAMVFQNFALFPYMTVFENMAFGLKFRNVPKEEIRGRVHSAAEILQLTELLERKPGKLSGGQRQRVAVGRAIVCKPKVFLFDEPLSNLDAKMRTQMRTEIARVHDQLGATIVYVTHDQTEAMTLGQRICVLNHGAVMGVGSPLELYREPQNRFVADFLGSPGMNLLPGRLTRDGGRIRFQICGEKASLVIAPNMNGLPDGVWDRDLELGVRPEHIGLAAPASEEPDAVEASVDHCESLGHETLVHVKLGGARLIARCSDDPACLPKGGGRIGVILERVVFFEPGTGQRIQ
jgi:multiple sugar transport system ATP-binding protein